MSKILRRAALVIGSVAVTAFLVELGARMYVGHRAQAFAELLARSERENPRPAGENNLMGLVRASALPGVVYELKPGLQTRFQGAALRTNALGLRGPETRRIRQPGTCRILGLGDSVLFGWAVEHEDTLLRQLARQPELAALPCTIETLNSGVPGHNTAQEVALFRERLRKLVPDLILVAYTGNDMLPPNFTAELAADGRPLLGGSTAWALLGGRLEELLTRLHPHPGYGDRFSDDPAADMTTVIRPLEELHALAREDRVPVVLMYSHYGIKLDRPDPKEPPRLALIEQTAKRLGWGFLDQSTVYVEAMVELGERTAEPFWIGPQDSHPNPRGLQLIARHLAPLVAERLAERMEP